ncbi:MAG: response regulator transcription factor [Syntrophomonadaceae bacterium]|nr:response regulator transcription factor [Syntrophomonadaceae bacterium]
MPVKVLIVDDDERERIVLRYVLEQIKDVEIVGEAVHGLEALLLCQEKKVDLVFLDITMPEMGGFETAAKLKTLKETPLFVFITVRKDMAVHAYELGALDYIVKPIEQSRIEKTIFRTKVQMSHRDAIEEMVKGKLQERINYIVEKFGVVKDIYSDKLPIREKGKITILNQKDIIYCESQGKKVFISTTDQGYLSNYTLNELETRLDSNYFFRAHQAFIVNLNYIKEIVNFGKGSYLLPLNVGNKNIILSRSRAKLLREKMGI